MESVTEKKRNPARQGEYGWSPAQARRAPMLELEDDSDWMGRLDDANDDCMGDDWMAFNLKVWRTRK
jgi:hypothetical protein